MSRDNPELDKKSQKASTTGKTDNRTEDSSDKGNTEKRNALAKDRDNLDTEAVRAFAKTKLFENIKNMP